MPTKQVIATGIADCSIEMQPIFGDTTSGVLHMIPGGTGNAEIFGGKIMDLYASTAVGIGKERGGHYHPVLNEFFFTVSGTMLWMLSDFREGSSTRGTTVGIILSMEKPAETYGLPCYSMADGFMPRLRVPAGVYHAYFPLTQERALMIGVGDTPYDREDYRYPTFAEVPGSETYLKIITSVQGNT